MRGVVLALCLSAALAEVPEVIAADSSAPPQYTAQAAPPQYKEAPPTYSAAAAPTGTAQAAFGTSDVIEADEGPVSRSPSAPYNSAYHGQYHHAVHRKPAPILTEEQYNSNANKSGANENTMNILLGAVCFGYGVLMVVYFMACCIRPRMAHAQPGVGPSGSGPFVRFPDAGSQPVKANGQVAGLDEAPYVCDLDPMWRKAFVGKVYTLLVIQIAITFAISFVMMKVGGYEFYHWSRTEGAYTRLLAFLFSIITLLAMFCFKSKFPINLVLLFAFTACMSYTVGIVVCAYAAAGLQVIVLEAFALTSIVFVGLTIFTIQSKIDFSFLGAILPVLLLVLIFFGLFARFAFDTFEFRQAYALAGTVIFSLYVLYDTHAITTYLSYDEYVMAAINLYLDFINLFLFILQLLSGGRRD